MTVDTSKYIHQGDFCSVVTDQFVDEGVKRGHLVFVAGIRALPVSEEDPYTQRIKMFVNLLKGDRVLFDEGLYLMDPKNLSKVSARKQKKLQGQLKALLDEEPDAQEGTTN